MVVDVDSATTLYIRGRSSEGAGSSSSSGAQLVRHSEQTPRALKIKALRSLVLSTLLFFAFISFANLLHTANISITIQRGNKDVLAWKDEGHAPPPPAGWFG